MDKRQGLFEMGQIEDMLKEKWFNSFRRKEVPVEEVVQMIRDTEKIAQIEKFKMPSQIEKVPFVKDYIRLNLTEGAC